MGDWLFVCLNLPSQLTNFFLKKKTITGEETWCFQYDHESKRQVFQWKQLTFPCPTKFRKSKSQTKTMLVTFFNIKCNTDFKFILQGKIFNHSYYVKIIKSLRGAVRRKRLELRPNDWILHNDSAAARKALPDKHVLAQKSLTEVEYQSCSPNLCSSNFWLFPKIKRDLKSRNLNVLKPTHPPPSKKKT
jgi:hypothetical protein